MPLRALTIDFWNTMVVARANGLRRRQQRLEHLLGVAQTCRPDVDTDAVRAAYREAALRFDAAWRQQGRAATTSDLVRSIWDILGINLDEERHAETVRVFEEGVLFGPPDLAEGLDEALAWAAQRYRLGIISDTMFSPGRVIRRLLEQHGVLRYFDAFVFSDETGFFKPDARAFSRAGAALGAAPSEIAHIGDLRRTDVAGARNAGLKAVLFTGIQADDETEPAPDAVLSHWRALPDVLLPF